MIRRLLIGLAVFMAVLGLAGGIFPKTSSASTQDFIINSFEADYYLTRNDKKTSLMQVNETIVATFPTFDQNHGILRAIPRTYQDHTVSLQINSVTSETGRPYNYTTSTQNDNLVLKIGDANSYVHGAKTYKINYQMKNVTSHFADHDELYWDVNGDQWPQAMNVVTARIHIPSDLVPSLQDRQECFTRCTITRVNTKTETIVTTTATNVRPYNTLTFVLGFNEGTFVPGPEIAAAKRHQQLVWALLAGSVVIPPLLTIGIMYNRWRKFGRDPKGRGVIVPQYQPPKWVNVLSGSYVLNEALLPKAITAAVIELAIKRYLNISEIKTKKLVRTSTDYELELIKDIKSLTEEQQLVLMAFFGAAPAVGSKVLISSLKNKLASDVKKIDTSLGKSQTVEGYFAVEPSKARGKYVGRGILVLIFGGILTFTGLLTLLGIGLLISGVIILAFSNKMPARTVPGVEMRDYLLGLKEFIKVVEEKRFAYLQTPEGAEKTGISIDPKNTKQKVKLFEELLPYAMIFGLEKAWAKEFEDIYLEQPAWYHGNYAAFNTAYLITSLNGISSANSVAFSSPASSSSSGFGGGGFSGGGGGGGGGGGW